MTQNEAQFLIDLQNVETALNSCGDQASALLAAALAAYRRRLEKKGGFVRLQPDPALDWLKYIQIEQGDNWLKLTDTRVKQKKK